MKLVNLTLVAAASAIFATACSSNTSNTNKTANLNTQPSPAASPIVQTAATPAITDTGANQLASARSTYTQSCAMCHGANGEGSQMGNMKIPSLKSKESTNDTDAVLAKQIANGSKGMPPFKDKLTPEQIQDLVRYIRQEIQGKAAK